MDLRSQGKETQWSEKVTWKSNFQVEIECYHRIQIKIVSAAVIATNFTNGILFRDYKSMLL